MKSPLTRIGYVVAIVAAVGYAFYSLRGPNGIPAWMQKREEIHQLEDRITSLRRDINLQKEYIRRLENSPSDQELEIRKRLKLVKPKEKIYIISP
jgi:cell division protein FtsB